MKSNLLKMITVMFLIFTFANSYAQEQPNPSKQQPVTASPKDEYVKKLNDFQPKLNDMLVKAKENISTNPELQTQVNQLNDMVAAFKGKLDKFDSTPRDQQTAYASSFNSDWSAIDSQYKKTLELSAKNPGEMQNKNTPPKQ